MEKILLDATPYTPFTDFKDNGVLIMKGRAFPENALEFFDPLISFIQELDVNSVTLDLDLEYFNTASAKKILHLLQALDDNMEIKNLMVNWRYEEGDEDSVETAEIFEDSLERIKFNYIEYAEEVIV